MKKPWWMAIFVLVIEIAMVLVFIPEGWTQQIIQKESELVNERLSTEAQLWLDTRASEWYQSSMIDSGLYFALYDMVIPSDIEKKNSKGLEKMGGLWFQWMEERLNIISELTYQLFFRIALLRAWLPYLAIMFIPALYDGVMSWKIKKTNFDYASPVWHRYSAKGTLFLGFGLFITLFLPVPLDPSIIPAVMVGGCVLMGLMMGNLQKRV